MKCLLILIGLLVLVSCVKPECAVARDCTAKSAASFSASCAGGKCAYIPIPNTCGNARCEQSEDQNTCPSDCICQGKVLGTQYLEFQSVQKQCVEGVIPKFLHPVILASDATNAGDKFHVETSYVQPFNLKKDFFSLVVRLEKGAKTFDERLLDAELSGMTKDHRKLVLGRKELGNSLWDGVPFEDALVLSFPSFEQEGELNTLVLKVRYEYAVMEGGRVSRKEGVFQVNYREMFVFVNSQLSYPCPSVQECDDHNRGTREVCGPQTNFFCVHEPVPGACGNGGCDATENKCTCAHDCGLCAGGGSFTELSCSANKCVASLRANTVITPNNIFESRDLGPITLSVNYKFNDPLNVKMDKFVLDLQRDKVDQGVTKVTIEKVRLLEGVQVVAEVPVNKDVDAVPVAIPVSVPALAIVESEKSLVVGVWYSYVQNEKTQEGMFQKPLGRLTLVSPG